MSHVFLVGFMGAGKSTVGRLLAAELKLPFLDLDAEIEKHVGMPIPRIFEERGEAGFRAAEHDALRDLARQPASVIACGGGVVLDNENRAELERQGHVVYLRVSAEEALARIGDVSGRPLLAGDAAASARTLLSSRESLYRGVADITVDTTGRTPSEIAAEVRVRLGGLS